VVVTQAATLPMVVAGVSLLLVAGGGLYWLVPGVAFSLVVAVVNAWVLGAAGRGRPLTTEGAIRITVAMRQGNL
jgi:hypothetical protein